MPDSVRLALGTLTVLRVPPPRRVTPSVARGAMLLAPAVGLLLALVASVLLGLVRVLTTEQSPAAAVDLLGSVLAIALLAWLTRGLHLDGLADVADGLGVKGDDAEPGTRARRLEVMRAPEVGAFGVVTLVLVLLVQVAALTTCVLYGYGTVSLITAVVTSRLAATWCAARGVPSARTDGLGAAVAGTVPRAGAAALSVLVVAGVASLGAIDDDRSLRVMAVLAVAALVGLVATWFVVRRCVARFGGITGDVIGATVELVTTTVLVTIAIALGLH